MAKCNECGYPWATPAVCTNCGKKFPLRSFSSCLGSLIFWTVLILLFLAMIFSLNSGSSNSSSNYEDTSSNKIEQIQPQQNVNESFSESENPIEETQNIVTEDQKKYTCRQCGKSIDWIGSYWLSCYINDNGTIEKNNILNEDLKLEGDDRVVTDGFYDEGSITRGIYCSTECLETDFSNWNPSF